VDVTLIVCGAPLTARAPDLLAALADDGWRPGVVATPAAAPWLDSAAVERLTGEPPRTEFRSPAYPKRAGDPAAVVVCPATFNTVNKAAAGAADTYALATLCEALGSRLPVLLVPMVNNKLWGHPAWTDSLAIFSNAGAAIMNVHTGEAGAAEVASGTGDQVVARFRPGWVAAGLQRLVRR